VTRRGSVLISGVAIELPPLSEELLVWLKGNGDADVKLDSHGTPENFTMSSSHCITLNGTDEYGTVRIDDATKVTFTATFQVDTIGAEQYPIGRGYARDGIQVHAAGIVYIRVCNSNWQLPGVTLSDGDVATIQVTYDLARVKAYFNGELKIDEPFTDAVAGDGFDWTVGNSGEGGVDFTGKVWDVELNGVHFRMAEGSSSEFSWSDDGVEHITWTGDLATMWAGSQDVYYGNAAEGFGYRENRLNWSEDFQSITWHYGGAGEGAGATSEYLETLAGNDLYVYNNNVNYEGFLPTGSRRIRVKVKVPSGQGETEVDFRFGLEIDAAYIWEVSSVFPIPEDGEYHEISAILTHAEVGVITGSQVVIRTANSDESALWVKEIQLEDVTNKAAENYSPYIKTQDYTFDGTEKLPFLNDNPGGTFNNCETKYAPEVHAVGTFNPDDNHILLNTPVVLDDFEVSMYLDIDPDSDAILISSVDGTSYIRWKTLNEWQVKIQSINYFFTLPLLSGVVKVTRAGDQLTLDNGDTTETLACTTLSLELQDIGRYGEGGFYVTGIIRDINLNGLIIPIDEGEGTVIHDSDNNVVGTLSDDSTFWDGDKLVAQSIIDAEDAAGVHYLTDGLGNPLPLSQEGWDTLGEELVLNSLFTLGSDNWSVVGAGFSFSDDRLVSSSGDANAYVTQAGVHEAGKSYELTVDYSLSSGTLRLFLANTSSGNVDNILDITGTGVTSIQYDYLNIDVLKILDVDGDAVGSIESISVREVSPLMNTNKQYYIGDNGVLIYKTPLTTEEDTEVKEYQGI